MKDLGMKQTEMYPSIGDQKDEKIYPSIEVPVSIMGDMSCKPGDMCSMEVKGEIESVDKKFVRIRLKEGQMDTDKDEGKSILKSA